MHKVAHIRRIGYIALGILVIAVVAGATYTVLAVFQNTTGSTASATKSPTVRASAQDATLKEAETSQKAQATSELTQLVNNFATSYGTKVGVVVTDLSTGATATKNADQSFVSASLYKLFVAYDVYREIDAGTLQYSTTLSTGSTIEQCLNRMITVSDNTCGVALGKLVGWANLDTLLQNEGYTGTMLNNYTSDGALYGDKHTTATDVARLFDKLYDGTLLSSASSAQFIQLLKEDTINTYLPSGLPVGTVIAHKIGDLYGYIHDAGIIYGTKKDVLVVLLTGEWSNPTTEGPTVSARLASAIWNWMES